MILYLDTGSLLKLFLEEEGSREVENVARAASSIASSTVCYAESRSALARASQSRRLNLAEYTLALQRFESEWSTYLVRDVTHRLVRWAGDLAEKHLLRAFDAIHLASALTLQDELAEPITFSAADDRLMRAAAAEGLKLP